jgi:glycosyl transferase family 2
MTALTTLRWALLAGQVALLVPIVYLAAISLAAIVSGRRRRRGDAPSPSGPPRQSSFVILVPAHDEENFLPALLESLAVLAYPKDRYTVCVVADNCTDRTAAVARTFGVRVYERADPERRSKGHALQWLLGQLDGDRLAWDAYVVVDADSLVDRRFLQAMERNLALGAQALQGYYGVRNPDASPIAALRWWALSLMNHVRSLGRNALGCSSALHGNGMCFTRGLLQRHPWRAVGLTEDYAYYLTLIAHGERVRYVPEAVVLASMPETFGQMRTQDLRWGSWPRGREARQIAADLLAAGARYRDPARLEAALELVTPSLSLLVGWSLLTMGVAVLLWWPPALAVNVLLIAGLTIHIASPFCLLSAPRGIYRACLHVPRVMVWKLWLSMVKIRMTDPTREWGHPRGKA